jgi:putative tryptophan/tyrosine transport system substrate-binding protein
VAAIAAAGKLGFEPRLLELIGQPPNYSAALKRMEDSPGEPIMILASPLFLRDRATIARLLERHTPSIAALRGKLAAGRCRPGQRAWCSRGRSWAEGAPKRAEGGALSLAF